MLLLPKTLGLKTLEGCLIKNQTITEYNFRFYGLHLTLDCVF